MNKNRTTPNGLVPGSYVQDMGNTDYILNGIIYQNAPTSSVLIRDESDLETLSDLDYEPGTIAYTAGFAQMWQLNSAGTWVSLL